MISACTIIAGNYLVVARVLANSFFAHHPGGSLTILIVDDEARQLEPDDARIDWRRLGDIGLDPIEIRRLAAIYDVTELSTAVKPRLLRQLLDEGHSELIYLDPDILIYDTLSDSAQLAARHGIVLTPHTIAPMPKDNRQADELFILAAGVYNLGFIAVGQGSRPFLDWWWQSTRRQALIDVQRMMFTDQRWIDFVPGLFDHHLLKDPGYNVAYWNLHDRDVTWSGGRYFANGAPLRFFHFSGFDTRKPWLLSRHQGERPRVLLSERPVLARICQEYLAHLRQAGMAGDGSQATHRPYGWHMASAGFELDRRMRRLYWHALREAEMDGRPEPPNPFDPADPDRFVAWLNAPAEDGPPRVSRYLLEIYKERIDLQFAFRDLHGADASAFADWIWRDGVAQQALIPELLPLREDDVPDNPAPPARAEGLTVVGCFSAEMGVGEAARLMTRAVDAAGMPHTTLLQHVPLHRRQHPYDERRGGPIPYDINLLCLNADSTPRFAHQAGAAFFDGAHTVGYWFWEVDPLPASMLGAFDHVDEVWTATDYMAGIFRGAGRKPVFTMPLAIRTPCVSPGLTRERFGLPQRFIFMLAFDFLSVSRRKNPLGLVTAFSRAFAPDEGPVLVIKSMNGHLRLLELEELRMAASARPDIVIIDRHVSRDENDGMLAACDCYVSLHRAEGLGLTMAEAMALGKPVIATGYSGNRHFMTPENSYLVDYSLTAVPPGCDPYPEGAVWASPDLDHAARLMRHVFVQPGDAAIRAGRGRADILEHHGEAVAAAALLERVDRIRRERRRRVDADVDAHVETATSTAERVERAVEAEMREAPARSSLDHAIPTAVRAIDALKPYFEACAEPRPVVEGRMFQGARRAAQRLLFRVLRPYWFQQRELQAAAINATVSSVNALAAGMAARHEAAAAFETTARSRLDELAATEAETQASIAVLEGLFASLGDPGRTPFLERTPDGARFGYGPTGNGHASRAAGSGSRRRAPHGAGQGEPLFRARQRVYVPLLRDRPLILDIGCGRGKMLDLLRVAKLRAIGVDGDPAMVDHCRANAHTVEHADALQFLRAQPGESIGAIFSARLMEQLALGQLQEFLRLCRLRLERGGLLIVETANPRAAVVSRARGARLSGGPSPAALTGAAPPIDPQVALALCQMAGFEQAYVVFPTGTGDLDADHHTQPKYAVLATAGARHRH